MVSPLKFVEEERLRNMAQKRLEYLTVGLFLPVIEDVVVDRLTLLMCFSSSRLVVLLVRSHFATRI